MDFSPLVVDLSSSYGAILIGTFFSFALWGGTCLQTFVYYLNYPDDRWWFKATVAALWMIDTAHQAMLVAGLWPPLIGHYGDYLALMNFSNLLLLQNVLAGVVITIVQLFFTMRIYIFSGRNKWFFLLLPVIATGLVSEMVNIVGGLPHVPFNPVTLNILIWVNSSVVVALDIFLSLCMCILLFRSKTGIQQTDRKIFRLMIVSVTSGGWSTLFAIGILISYATVKNQTDLVFLALGIPMCPCYCNTLLANLNTRRFVGRGIESRKAVESSTGLTGSSTATNRRSANGLVLTSVVMLDSKASDTRHKDPSFELEDWSLSPSAPPIGPHAC